MKWPNSSLVAVAWLKTLPGVDSRYVATQLPPSNFTFGTSGFCVVTVVGGSPDAYLPEGHPVLQVDIYAIKEGSARPPWNACEDIAVAVTKACEGNGLFREELTLPGTYMPARVLQGQVIGEPKRAYGDGGSLAHIRVEIELHWTVV